MGHGRNAPCHCGSGKKFKKCCLGKEKDHVKKFEGHIDIDSFPPKVFGFEEIPDFKYRIERALLKHDFDDDLNVKNLLESEFLEYNDELQRVNKLLPEPYGVMLKKLKSLVEASEDKCGLRVAGEILRVFPGSFEARFRKEEILLRRGDHILQRILSQYRGKLSWERQLKEICDPFRESSPLAQEWFLESAIKLYESSNWAERNRCIDFLKIVPIDRQGDELIQKVDLTIIRGLKDDDGRVRNNAVFAADRRRGLFVPIDLFFHIAEELKKEHVFEKKKALGRAILKMVSPITDEVMSDIGEKKRYKETIEEALRVTSSDPTYYLATPLEKMRFSLLGLKK